MTTKSSAALKCSVRVTQHTSHHEGTKERLKHMHKPTKGHRQDPSSIQDRYALSQLARHQPTRPLPSRPPWILPLLNPEPVKIFAQHNLGPPNSSNHAQEPTAPSSYTPSFRRTRTATRPASSSSKRSTNRVPKYSRRRISRTGIHLL